MQTLLFNLSSVENSHVMDFFLAEPCRSHPICHPSLHTRALRMIQIATGKHICTHLWLLAHKPNAQAHIVYAVR